MAYLYKHIRKDTREVFYIGIGKAKRRITSSANRNNYWHNIVSKVGFIAEIIEDDLEWKDAIKKEIELIKFYGRLDMGTGCLVNMTDGGDGVVGHSDEVRKKISDAGRRRIIKDETRQKLKDRIITEETKNKISKS